MSKTKYDELNADDIFAINDLEIEELDIEQWKGRVYMLSFTGAERARLQQKTKTVNLTTGEGSLELMLWFVIHGLCDANGKRIFDDSIKTHTNLKKKQGAVLEAIAEAVMKFNGMKDIEEDVKAEAKNS